MLTIQQEILNGLMLGDGSLSRKKTTHNTSLNITRTIADKEYIYYHAAIFKHLLSPKSIAERSYFDRRTQQTYYRITLRTRNSKELNNLYDTWYSNGIKCIPTDLQLTPLTIATWFADDGNLYIPNRGLMLKFATHGFDKKDVNILADKLYEKYNFKFSVYKDLSHYIIICSRQEDIKILLRDIDPYFPNGMERKSSIWRAEKFELFIQKQYPTCKFCNSDETYKNGRNNQGKQKFYCASCKRQFIFTGQLKFII